jgi:hypothetical protein
MIRDSSLSRDSVLMTAEMVDRIMAEDDANDPALANSRDCYG